MGESQQRTPGAQSSVKRLRPVLLVIAACCLAAAPAAAQYENDYFYGDVPYVPTPQPVVEAMLELAEVGPNDIVYDLGSGDGRIVITAAKKYGCRAVGIEINPRRVEEARENAKKAGVADRVKFIQGDMFKADIHEATVVTLYLLSSVNEKLKPKLFKELRPGTRVVSHRFTMPDWKPVKQTRAEGRPIYLWRIPERRQTRR